jgi:uncharacterized protein (TIGR00255 family)
MTLNSMTGFGRASGAADFLHYVWELKSVNGKALDIRLRLPSGWDTLEAPARQALARYVSRGNVSASLSLSGTAPQTIRINEEMLAAYVAAANTLSTTHAVARPNAAELLALRGVADVMADIDSDAEEKIAAVLLAGLENAAAALAQTRAQEGKRLAPVLISVIERIDKACAAAAVEAAEQPKQVSAKLKQRLDDMAAGQMVDPERLAQEVALIALKFDVTEELDRLSAHISAARDLLDKPEPVGRAFDFLAQEFNREINTLCSKSASVPLTRIGLELKGLIDQLREQVQNLE